MGLQAALEGSTPHAISVYLTGLETGEWNWRFTSVPGYDWPRRLADQAQVSLTIDMLGHGSSGHPPGNDSCYGSQADVTHQIIQQLRNGQYQVGGGTPVKFARIALVGHDVGGAFAEIEAYSYKDVDGLIVLTWADQGQTPLILDRSLRTAPICSTGGEAAYPGGPSGYFYIERPDEYQPDLFYNFDPRVLAAFVQLRERNPCGYEPTTTAALGTDIARLREIHVPVLLAIGAEDKIWTQDGWAQQQQEFTGTSDVTAVSLANTGHYPMLERTAPTARALVANWLIAHRFAGTPQARPHASPTPLLRIARRTARVGHSRIVRVRVTCLAESRVHCVGRLQLHTTRRRNARRHGSIRELTPRATAFRIAAGRTKTVRIRISRSAYHLLEQHRRLHVTATLLERAADGTVATFRNRLTLRLATRAQTN